MSWNIDISYSVFAKNFNNIVFENLWNIKYTFITTPYNLYFSSEK